MFSLFLQPYFRRGDQKKTEKYQQLVVRWRRCARRSECYFPTVFRAVFLHTILFSCFGFQSSTCRFMRRVHRRDVVSVELAWMKKARVSADFRNLFWLGKNDIRFVKCVYDIQLDFSREYTDIVFVLKLFVCCGAVEITFAKIDTIKSYGNNDANLVKAIETFLFTQTLKSLNFTAWTF